MLLAYGTLIIGNVFLNDLLGEEAIIDELYFNNHASILALIIVIIAGCIAGWVPARKAISISPIDAIRQE